MYAACPGLTLLSFFAFSLKRLQFFGHLLLLPLSTLLGLPLTLQLSSGGREGGSEGGREGELHVHDHVLEQHMYMYSTSKTALV